LILRSKLDSKRDTCIKRKRKHSVNRLNPEIGGGILHWGGFSARGKLYTDFENRGKSYAGALFSSWGKFYPGPVFLGEKSMLQRVSERAAWVWSPLSACCVILSFSFIYYFTKTLIFYKRTISFSRVKKRFRGDGGYLYRYIYCQIMGP
jgi:hypothetical protein